MQRKLYNPIAILMLVVVLATVLAHSTHATQVEVEGISAIEKHDCLLCQQGVDSTSKEINVAFVSQGVFTVLKTDTFNAHVVIPAYSFAQLRAPPADTFL